jgi:Tfp pilus assembly protein PilN
VIRFNYVDEPLISVADRLLSSGFAKSSRAPLLTAVTLFCVLAGWWLVERRLLANALDEAHRAQAQLNESQALLAQSKIERRDFYRVLTLDRRLLDIRDSGSLLASEVADVANRIPPHAWLHSLTFAATGIDMTGNAVAFDVLGMALSGIGSSAAVTNMALVRATSDAGKQRANVSFEIRAERAKRP